MAVEEPQLRPYGDLSRLLSRKPWTITAPG